MNATNIATIQPQSIIRQTRVPHAALSAGPARHEPERVITFTAAPVSLPTDLKATAIGANNDVIRRDLAPLLKLVTWIFQPMAQSKNILLRLEAPEIGLYVTCQEVRIQRVLENLISNALRYAPANSQITLAARSEDGRLCIWVEDQGTGVPLANQATLFDGDEPSFGEYAMGVDNDNRGLVVSKEIVNAHGGEILMYNRVSGGAHFEFRLPTQQMRNGLTHSGTFTRTTRSGLVKVMPLQSRIA